MNTPITSSTTSSSTTNVVGEAERFKQEGNTCFKQKLYNKAVYFYTKAIELDPDSTKSALIWSNRAQTYLNLHKPEKAYIDACAAVQRDPRNSKALFRKATALNRLGLKKRAREVASHCAKMDPANKDVRELVKQLEDANDTELVDLTVFMRPEPLQSRKPLIKRQLKTT